MLKEGGRNIVNIVDDAGVATTHRIVFESMT